MEEQVILKIECKTCGHVGTIVCNSNPAVVRHDCKKALVGGA